MGTRPKILILSWLSAVCLTSLFLFPRVAYAYCGAPQEISPSGEYYQSDLVFTGTVTAGEYDQAAGGEYQLHVIRIYRGPIRKTFTVTTNSDDSRLPLVKGRSYLLFATIGTRGYEITSCGNSGLLSRSAKAIHVLNRLRYAPPFGVIAGWVISPSTSRVTGIQIKMDGGSRNYSAISDKNGWFHMRVPIGRYSAVFSSQAYHLDPQDTYRYDARSFVIHSGETALLEFVAGPQGQK